MQLPITEKISDGLREAEKIFLAKCQTLNTPYDLQCDTPTERGYEINDKSLMKSFMDLVTELPDTVIMTINGVDPYSSEIPPRRNGFMVAFHEKPISDGHWKLLTDKDKKSHKKMSFLHDDDADKVDFGDTLAQHGKKVKELNASGYAEDQYKNPTSRHRRAQAPFRSAFDKKNAKSFGGVCEEKYPSEKKGQFRKIPSIAGQMIPPYLEPSSSVATVGAAKVGGFPEVPIDRDGRSNKIPPKKSITSKDPTERAKPKYRADLTDVLSSKYESPFDLKEQIEVALEDSQPRTRIGRTTDPALYTRQQPIKNVPNPCNEPSQKITPNESGAADVERDDVASRERQGEFEVDNPHFQVGMAGVRPQTPLNSGGPVSNINTAQKAGPAGAGAFFPNKITVTKSPTQLPTPASPVLKSKRLRLRGIA